MKRYFVDTNIFLRAILEDHKTQSPKAKGFLKNIKTSKNSYYTTAWVITEIVWTLGSLYKYKKEHIARIIRGIINTPNLRVLEKDLVLRAIALFEEKNVDFIDCLNFLISKENEFSGIVSFDQDFDRLEAKRIEP